MPNDVKSFTEGPRAQLSPGFTPVNAEGKSLPYCPSCEAFLTPFVAKRRNGSWKITGVYCAQCFGSLSLKQLAAAKHTPDAQEVETP